eukprot:364821-Chlamydomonas_euryale.AAC.5
MLERGAGYAGYDEMRDMRDMTRNRSTCHPAEADHARTRPPPSSPRARPQCTSSRHWLAEQLEGAEREWRVPQDDVSDAVLAHTACVVREAQSVDGTQSA